MFTLKKEEKGASQKAPLYARHWACGGDLWIKSMRV